MEIFIKRICLSMWIVWIIILLSARSGYGIQGVPTWICLGIKSPFIEFKSEVEILSNISVSLNSSTTEKGLNRNKNGVQNLGPFVYPMDQYNDSNSHIRSRGGGGEHRKSHVIRVKNRDSFRVTENPIVVADINSKKEVDVEMKNEDSQDDDGNAHGDRDRQSERKYIIPLALKNPPSSEPSATRKSQFFQDSKTNIDDLKRHILMLQNLTKNDQNFQSKFVVFPNLQRNLTNEASTTSTTTTSTTTIRPIKSSISFNIPKQNAAKEILRGIDDVRIMEPVTIVPQVFLQNDQTPMSDETFFSLRNENDNQNNSSASSRRYYRKKAFGYSTTTAMPPSSTKTSARRQRPFRRNKNMRKKYQCRDGFGSHSNCPRTIPNSPSNTTIQMSKLESNVDQIMEDRKLTRNIRSNPYVKSATKDPIFPSVAGTANPNNNQSAYREQIDLNPNLCYNVSGLSYGQQKLCVLHTHIMPAISRGARAAIQECKYQFRNRRWNCSTVDDDTVFGPISGVGSPEMAFVHAMAAAGAASFIARACRDGQLTSCGCSRSSRPKQLHEDWTWGGCGDDLEFGYKFAQSFIDIREKEKKRGTRGLVTIPQKTKLEEKLLNENSNETLTKENENGRNENPVKSEDLLELQEKITKEILSSKLQEKEMQELQEKINKELLNSKVFSLDHHQGSFGGKKKQHRIKVSASAKARSMMNLHNNEAGRRAVIKKSRITCKCHGVSGSCSLITCWQQLTSMREIGEHLRVKYDEATQVKLNKRGRLQVKDPRYKVPTALDLVYLDESPDWCRANKQLQWPGTHNRICNKTSAGLDGCAILCCGRGYNTKKIVVKERCNCKFHWCCQVKCETCVKVIEEYSCK